MEPGIYYVGDPCYIIEDSEWIKYLSSMSYRGCLCPYIGTAYGDGEYPLREKPSGKKVGSLCVDAGIIGLIPLSILTPEEVSAIKRERLGAIIDMPGNFNFSRDRRGFKIGEDYFVSDPE